MTRGNLRRSLASASSAAFGSTAEFSVQRDFRAKPGGNAGWTSNLALVLARETGLAPVEIATRLKEFIDWPGAIEEANGFLNFVLDTTTIKAQLERAAHEGERYGASDALSGQRFAVEFVSADPTGPLPFPSGRIAAAGDALCRVLAFAGADVTREFYLNDVESSTSMRLLGESVSAVYLSKFGHAVEPPEGALQGDFISRVADEIAASDGNKWVLVPEAERTAHFAHSAREAAVASQRATLKEFGVRFDVWSSENALREEGRVESAVRKLTERGHTYERDGATWLRTTSFGDGADRVLVRAGGKYTYLASDIAYHVFKMERAFDHLVNIWSAEHESYIPRTRAALQAIGCDPKKLEVVPCAGARWLHDGKPVQRGKGGGAFTLDEALHELHPETLRFLLVRTPWNEPLSIDTEKARRDDETNAAYAARLLPSRLATQIRELQAHNGETSDADANDWSAGEREIARLVSLWPDTVQTAAIQRAPHIVAAFVTELATAVRDDLKAGEKSAGAVRLPLLRAASNVAIAALKVLGLSGTERF
ncbi:MAG TPA: arginine--tRNA ligase [Abditibacteriaceae bacterium]